MIRFQRPSLPAPQEIERYLAAAREERWFSNFGPCCLQLTERLQDRIGCEAVPVVNATLGLLAAVAALRHRSPQSATQALVPSFAFAASAQAAIWNGLELVFVDIARTHWHLDPDELERELVERAGRVAIVIALSSFGTPPPPEVRQRWESVCANAEVPLLVDSAAGFGGVAADGTPIGAQGDAEVVSFHAVKPLAIGEGGVVFSRDAELAAEIRRLIQFGFDDQREVTMTHGLNAKLSEPSAAIALAALDGFDHNLDARREAAAKILAELPSGFEPQIEHERGTWQFVPVAARRAELRDAVLAAARDVVEIRTYYQPLHTMRAFSATPKAGALSATDDVTARMLSLPMADDLTGEEIDTIVETLRDAMNVHEESERYAAKSSAPGS
jgi:dTDP-4-amino-4,6-dideoxygalactose transaminase